MEENEEEDVVRGTMTKRDLFAERCFIVTMTIHARCCRLVYGALVNTISSEAAIVIIQLITLYLL